MSCNLKGVLRYDGGGFHGWQVQPGLRTVQGDVEAALARIASQPIRVHGAGRTDAGVHALGQVFSCQWPADAPPERLRRSLSQMLGPEIRVESIEVARPDFHARFAAVAKRYAYTISLCHEPDPFTARYAWSIPWPVDMERLAALAATLEGEHDFAGFQASGVEMEVTRRTLHSVTVRPGGAIAPCDARGLWRIDFHGDGFLYKMVRNLVGTLVDIARGKLPEEALAQRLAAPSPYHGHTAPAHGLTLIAVEY